MTRSIDDDAYRYGYYEPLALATLERPIVLSGMVWPEVRKVGATVAAKLGVRFVNLQESVEHQEGAALRELEKNRPAHEIRRAEVRQLERALVDRPYGLVALSDRALSTRKSQSLLRRQAELIVLDYDVRDCYRRYHRLYLDEIPTWIYEAPDAGKLTHLYRQWTRRFRAASTRVDMTDRSWEEAARRLAERLI